MHPRKAIRLLLLASMMFAWALESMGADFSAHASLNLRYDYNDNIFFDSDDTRNLGDAITVFSPGIIVSERTENARAEAGIRFDHKEYRQYGDLDTTDKRFSGEMAYDLSPVTGISGAASWVQDSGIDRDILTTGLLLDRNKRQRKNFSLSGYHRISETMKTDLSCGHQKETFDGQESSDNTSDKVSLSLTRDMGRYMDDTSVFITLRCERYGYEESMLSDVDNYSLDAGCSAMPRENTALNLSAGMRRTVSRFEPPLLLEGILDETSVDNGFTGRASLEYRGETTTLSLTASRDIGIASGDSAITERTSLIASAERRHRDKLLFSISASAYLNTAREGRMSTEDVDERTLTITPRIVYHLTKDIDLTGSYAYTRLRDSEADTTSIDQVFSASLSFRHSFYD